VSVESLLARLRSDSHAQDGVIGVTGMQPYGGAASGCNPVEPQGVTRVTADGCGPANVTPATPPESQGLQPEPYGQAACTLVTPVTPENADGRGDAGAWLASVAAHLDTTPAALLAAGLILPDEVTGYADSVPAVIAEAIRRAHPGLFPERATYDRRHCRTCLHRSGYHCRARHLFVMDDLPRRCSHYAPKPDEPDQRPGCELWPAMKTDSADGRAAEYARTPE